MIGVNLYCLEEVTGWRYSRADFPLILQGLIALPEICGSYFLGVVLLFCFDGVKIYWRLLLQYWIRYQRGLLFIKW